MKNWKENLVWSIAVLVIACSMPLVAAAQDRVVILTGAGLSRVVPPGFYFQGLSAPTQIRNAAAARFGSNRYVIAGLVDTAGYAAEVRDKYEGFFITDSTISINGSELGVGAYGFGFNNNGRLNILDLAGNQEISVSTAKDSSLRRPRPLTMIKSGNNVRLYRGKDYAVIAVK